MAVSILHINWLSVIAISIVCHVNAQVHFPEVETPNSDIVNFIFHSQLLPAMFDSTSYVKESTKTAIKSIMNPVRLMNHRKLLACRE